MRFSTMQLRNAFLKSQIGKPNVSTDLQLSKSFYVPTHKTKIPSLKPAMTSSPTTKYHAALIITGHARSLAWKMVCENIKTRLVDALVRPPSRGISTNRSKLDSWTLDVFLFLSLVDKDSTGHHGRLKKAYGEQMMETCINLLKPVYVEFMPSIYQPPKMHNCTAGNEPLYITHSRKKTAALSKAKKIRIWGGV